MAQLICLANSWRPGGRCIAGIDCATGKWVRPVPPRGDAIPEERTWLNGRCIRPLDIIEMQVEAPTLATRFQCENCAVRNWNWRLVGRAVAADVFTYCTRVGTILHSRNRVVEPAQMELLAPEKWTSLELVRVRRVVFGRDPRKASRWQAKFSMGPLAPEYCIPVTDPEVTLRLAAGEKIAPECLLTISLTGPVEIHEHNKPELCYKLVACVIELGAD
jgi:hypothetical protein